MKPARNATAVEVLETRIAPATLSLIEGVLVYTASAGVQNDIVVNVSGASLVISDGAETINVAAAPGFVLSNGNLTATGPDASVAVLVINSGNGSDLVRIFATNDQTNISGTGTLNVVIGNGTTQGIRNLVDVDGSVASNSALLVNGATNTAATTVTVTAGGIGAGPGDNFFGLVGQVLTTGVKTITLQTGTGLDTVRVQSTAPGTQTNLSSAGGLDDVLVGDGGSVQGILGQLSVAFAGSPVRLTVDSSADATARVVTVSDTQVTGLAPTPIAFNQNLVPILTVAAGSGNDVFNINCAGASAIARLNVVSGGGGNDVFNVIANSPAVTVNGGEGDDIFTVGTGNLAANSGLITVNGGGQSGDQLILDDTDANTGDFYRITAGGVTCGGGPSVSYSGLAGVTLLAQNVANGIDVIGTAANTPVTIHAGGGDDTFTFSGDTNTLDGFLSPVSLDGGAGSDSLVLDDTGKGGGGRYVVDGMSFHRNGVTLIASAVNVEALSLTTGGGNDTVDARLAGLGLTLNTGSGNDVVFGSVFADQLNGGFGLDTYVGSGLGGNATVTDAGVSGNAALGNDVFVGGRFELVKLIGDSGANVFNASAYNGFAILDGVGGRDEIKGSEVIFTPKSVLFKDADGDRVTLKTSKGRLSALHLDFQPTSFDGGAQLLAINLLGDQTFKGATIGLAAKPDGAFGDSFVNVGLVNAEGVDLAGVTIAGDLTRILVGNDTSDKPGLGKLAVQSLGVYGAFTQGGSSNTTSVVKGKLGALTVKGRFHDGAVFADQLGVIAIGGSLGGDLIATGGIAAVNVRGSVEGGSIGANGVIGPVKIGGNFIGTLRAGLDSTFAPASQAKSVVLKSLTVGGDVRQATILAGGGVLDGNFNADVSVGAITVGGSWEQSNLSVGVKITSDVLGIHLYTLGTIGTNAGVVARIASITIKGQVIGSSGNPFDQFSFAAQQIGVFKLGAAKLPLTTETDPAFTPGITGFDVVVREVA